MPMEHIVEGRRTPKQERARLTVASILEATEILAREGGFMNLETSRIAAKAGISVGSLYQYFANLQSILLSLYEKHSTEVAYKMKTAMVNALDESPEHALLEVMWIILRLHERHHLILHQMVDEVPQLNLAHHPTSLKNLIHGSVSAYLKHQQLAKSTAEMNRKARILESIVFGCIKDYLDDPGNVSKAAFVKDLNAICVYYIRT
ncbi:MAG: transcriptional regulator, TetR family [Nevskia sp.]|nr:transcriptional regulator, TetR family [Nevskia sp.]